MKMAQKVGEKWFCDPCELVGLARKVESGELVEVVRCKDCKHYVNIEVGWCDIHSHYTDEVLDTWTMFMDDDYCSDGERKKVKSIPFSHIARTILDRLTDEELDGLLEDEILSESLQANEYSKEYEKIKEEFSNKPDYIKETYNINFGISKHAKKLPLDYNQLKENEMISKENFIKYMNELHSLCKAEDELNNALQNIGTENILWFDKHKSLIVDILQDAFDDKENDWIGYAIYELDWFSKYEDGTITFDGKNVPLKDAGDLYDLLVDNMNYKSKF
ncbi:MAG: hypothetical protein PHN69_05635 [Candidatus Pacebacteria bacterium]|nr:hypothetical protein [Candidatus Paceibacterota bacterium]